ncbi:chemotaxis protein CheY [Candidatus Woesearchaeota archaeon CG11_big_fil_rev_8_21_14_0_20_43_8]|nr:MAG: chemotaxis protein CheY [Candidatus Woesearchaeota archaeon CG11_big_fil_rev_8_21_14_0_20_43_8]PIO06736.1 MAG: chemotaxis protein CheY [Candidatus Woesearchaeota archaeon CG08_land_8_20_14_0_20_43_7]
MKLIVVDDDKDVTYSISEALKDLDPKITVRQANSAKECLSLLEKFDPDLIILDVMMSEMNGWELSIKLKGNQKSSLIPIVFLTCLDDPACKRMGLTYGVDYIQKPFDSKTLYKTIKSNILRKGNGN